MNEDMPHFTARCLVRHEDNIRIFVAQGNLDIMCVERSRQSSVVLTPEDTMRLIDWLLEAIDAPLSALAARATLAAREGKQR